MCFFHLQACHRHTKKHIECLVHHGNVVIDEQQKAEVIFQQFDEIIGNHESHSHGLDFATLGLSVADLSGLDFCFSEDEIWNVIQQLPPDKAPGPDRFTGRFYQCVAGDQARHLACIQCLLVLGSSELLPCQSSLCGIVQKESRC
jgi:hypothetical protein